MYDIIVVGAGPAGMTAALYARRAGKSVLLLEQGSIGGQITFSPRVENFPGIKAVSGIEFSDTLADQVSEQFWRSKMYRPCSRGRIVLQ